MKAITMWQPWASLLACGAKQYETRPWATNYRGEIAIHAAVTPFQRVMKKVFPLHEWNYAPDSTAKREFVKLVSGFIDVDNLPLGCIIATAELVGCHEMVRHGGRGISSTSPGWLETDNGIYMPTDQEAIFGDWTPGRYAWEFRNMKMLPEPIPAKGKQRIWNWEGSI